MGRQAQKIFSLWLALALLTAPLPAFSSASAHNATGHCLSNPMNPADLYTALDAGSADSLEQAMPGCSQCKDPGCADNGCGDSGCSPCHGSISSLPAPAVLLADYSQALYARPALRSPSRTDPPLLRPPL